MHTRAVWLSASHMQRLWRIGKVIRPALPLPTEEKEEKTVLHETHRKCVGDCLYVCVCVSICVFVCAHACTCPLVLSSASKAGDQCLVIACLWLHSLSRLQLQLQHYIKTQLRVGLLSRQNWSCGFSIYPKLPLISRFRLDWIILNWIPTTFWNNLHFKVSCKGGLTWHYVLCKIILHLTKLAGQVNYCNSMPDSH